MVNLERFANDAETTLSGACSTGDGTISVVSTALFPALPQFRVRIGDEIMLVTAGSSGETWAVDRGVDDTTVAG